jgi:head-tail adaptor
MMLLGAADLTWMREVQALALPGTAVILRGTVAADGMGGGSVAWAAAGTVSARLYSQNSRAVAESAQNGAQVISVTRWYVTLPVGTDVTAADRLSVAGRLFDVTEVNNDQDWKTAVRCAVTAMNEETA